ncbi:MAG TPA: hypothetical protein VFU98_13610 [Microlunatus sp.]|nr:hypothetical protein [Microlunatus sp.]
MSVTASAGGGVRRLAQRSGLGRLWRRVSTWFLAYLPERSRVRRPPVRIHTAAAVPAVALRSAIALVGLLCASVVVIGTPSWVVVIALLVGLACAPGTMIGGALVITLGLLMMFDPEPAAAWRTPLLIAAVPLMMQLAAIAGQTTWAGRIELRVLALPVRRYLAAQVFAQLLGLVGVLVAGLGYVLPQVMALGAAAVLALVAFWLPSLGPARRRD